MYVRQPIYRRNTSLAVKEFWALRDNTYGCVITALNFPLIIDGQFTSFFMKFVSEKLIRDFCVIK